MGSKFCTIIINLLPFQGDSSPIPLKPMALPWAMIYCAFSACHSELNHYVIN